MTDATGTRAANSEATPTCRMCGEQHEPCAPALECNCGNTPCCHSEGVYILTDEQRERLGRATRNRAAEIIAAELRRHLCFTHPDTARRQADAVVKRLHEAGINV